MKKNTQIGFAILCILTIILIVVFTRKTTVPAENQITSPINTTLYSCDGGKTINAQFYQGEIKQPVTPDMPPIPTGSVALSFNDGSNMTLPQTISADGTRYANADESFIFWGKGNGAMVLENNVQKNYQNCIMVSEILTGSDLTEYYANGGKGFSIRYNKGFTIDDKFTYQNLGPGKDISGVKFTIPASLASGTNLSTDSYLSVEQIPNVKDCSASLFLPEGSNVKMVPSNPNDLTDQIVYSMGTISDAAAGNRYDETVYASPYYNSCIAIRYLIHYGVFENYPAGTIKKFDEQALLSQFDQIRKTLVVNQ